MVAVGHKYADVYRNSFQWLDAPEKVLHGATDLVHDVAGGFHVDQILKNASILAFLARIGVPEAWLPAAVASGMSPLNACIVLGCVELTRALTNTEATVGFQPHILRSDDAGRTLRIELAANHEVTFRSHSGVSETVASRFDLRRALKL